MTIVMCPLASGECMYAHCEFWHNGCMIKEALKKYLNIEQPAVKVIPIVPKPIGEPKVMEEAIVTHNAPKRKRK